MVSIQKITRQMHSIEGASLSKARGVPDIRWAPRDASFLVGPGSKGSLCNSHSCAWPPERRIKWKQQEGCADSRRALSILILDSFA